MKTFQKIFFWIYFFCSMTWRGYSQEGSSKFFWTLEETIARALQNNPQLVKSKELVAQAELEEPMLLANTDPFFFGYWKHGEDWSPNASPQILGTRTVEEQFGAGLRQKWLTGTQAAIALRSNRTDADAIFRAQNPTHTGQFELNLRQPLLKDFFGRPDKALRKKARQNVKSVRAQHLKSVQELIVKISKAYFDLAFAIEDFGIKEKSTADLEKLLLKQKEKRNYGIAEESDVLQTQAALRLQKLEGQIAQTQIRIARQALLTLLNESQKKEEIAPLKHTADFKLSSALDSIEIGALTGRPDIEAAQSRVEALKAELRVMELNALPSLDIVSRTGFSSLGNTFSKASGDLSERGKPYYVVGVELDIPLFRKIGSVNLSRARSELRESEAALALTVEGARQEFLESKELYLLAAAKKNAQKDVLELQKRKLLEEEKNFQRGRSATDTIIRFQFDLHEAERLLIKAELAENLAAIQLEASMGKLAERFWNSNK